MRRLRRKGSPSDTVKGSGVADLLGACPLGARVSTKPGFPPNQGQGLLWDDGGGWELAGSLSLQERKLCRLGKIKCPTLSALAKGSHG